MGPLFFKDEAGVTRPGAELMTPRKDWKKVVFADECKQCDMCDDLICYLCGDHYAECDCPGPTQDGIEYKEIDEVLYGREEN